jgi:uncharacterized Zn-finger protein
MALLCALTLVAPAQATFPGTNGMIAFEKNSDIWTMNPDGSNQVDITNTPSSPAPRTPTSFAGSFCARASSARAESGISRQLK